MLRSAAKKLRLVKDGDPSMTGEHIREGLAGCVSVKVRRTPLPLPGARSSAAPHIKAVRLVPPQGSAREAVWCRGPARVLLVLLPQVPNPEFEGQTKTRLGNPEVRRILDAAVTQHASEWLELHPAALQAVVSKVRLALGPALPPRHTHTRTPLYPWNEVAPLPALARHDASPRLVPVLAEFGAGAGRCTRREA